MRKILGSVLLLCVLAACQADGRLADRSAPGVDRGAAAADGLTVGHRLMEAGEYELARKAYLRAAAENGMSVDVLSAVGSANLALGRLGQAEQLLRRAVELDPSFVPALNNLGVALINQGKAGEARQVFQQAFALDSGRTDAIRENLRLAIAQVDGALYAGGEDDAGFALIRRGPEESVLLSDL